MSIHTRQRRRLIVFGLLSGLLLLVVGILWSMLAQQRPPRYRGLTTTEWSAKMDSLTSDEFAAAFGAEGLEPVPVLVQGLTFMLSPLGQAYASLYPKLPAQVRGFLSRPVDPVRVRWESASLLAKMGSNAAPAMPALIGALSDPEYGVRLGASGAVTKIRLRLGREWPMDSQAVAALLPLMNDTNQGIRGNVVSGIYLFGDAATNAIPFLESSLQDPDEEVRKAATNSLRQIMVVKAAKP